MLQGAGFEGLAGLAVPAAAAAAAATMQAKSDMGEGDQMLPWLAG